MNQKYSPEMRERTLRMLDETKASGEHRNLMTAIRHVAGLLDMSPETLRVWHRRREDPPGLRAPAARRAAPSRDQTFARGEPQRLRGTEDARPPETSGMEHRPRPDHEALRLAGACGVARSKKVRTTKSPPAQTLPKNLVNKGLHHTHAEPAVGRGHNPCHHMGRDWPCRVHDRHVHPQDHRLEPRLNSPHRSAATTHTEHGSLQRSGTTRRAGPSHRSRAEPPLDCAHGPDRRARCETLDRNHR